MILCKTDYQGGKKRKKGREMQRVKISELLQTEPVDLKSRWQLTNTHETGCSCVRAKLLC